MRYVEVAPFAHLTGTCRGWGTSGFVSVDGIDHQDPEALKAECERLAVERAKGGE